MKHSLMITLILVAIFFGAQIIGLTINSAYIDVAKTQQTGKTAYEPLLQIGQTEIIERPEIEKQSTAFIYVLLAILVGTILALFLMKRKSQVWWKAWFFIAITVCLAVAFNAFIPTIIAIILAVLLALYKILRPSIIIHNLTELFIYGGLVAIFVPIFDIKWAIMLLLAISVYDAYAVWHSKHMIKLAQAQSKAKVFAGLFIPYKFPKKVKKANKKTKKKLTSIKTAILGGGDIGFPLLFAAIVMIQLGLSFLQAMIIPAITTIALFLLLYYSKKDKFYPAMPFLTAGCLVGYFIVLLI